MQLPSPFPDEILFSRLVRHLMMSGLSIDCYLKSVFGNRKVSIHPYLTSGLDLISKLSKETSEELLYQQTLAPLFIYYLPNQRPSITSGVATNSSKAIRSCQLVCFREKEKLTIKFCASCAKEDARNYGVSYWHRSHQILGIESCPKHKIKLGTIPLVGRAKINDVLLPPLNGIEKQCSLLDYEFSQYATDLLAHVSCNSDCYEKKVLENELAKKGYKTPNGGYRRKKILKDLFSFSVNLDFESSVFLPKSEQDYRYISPLLEGVVSQHPFKYMLLSFWLSKQAEPHTNQIMKYCDTKKSQKKLSNDVEQKCIEMLKAGESMSSVSKRTGKSQSYLKLLAMKLNIPINLNPKLLTQDVKHAVMTLAQKGFHRFEIAKQTNISVGSVEQLISTKPPLVVHRKKCKHESKRRKYKLNILRYRQKNPTARRKEIKLHCSAAFFWLYMHEKEWLEANLPPPTKPQPQPKVCWRKRDLELVKQVIMLMEKHGSNLSRTQLDKLLGKHEWLTKYKKKLPLTLKTYHSLYKKKD